MTLFLGALVTAVGAFLIFLELLIRDAAIYVSVLFLPLVFAGLVWPAAAHWSKRLVETLVAIIREEPEPLSQTAPVS